MEKYIDGEGKEYESYEAFCNAPDLDPDLIYNYLARGMRTPQNDKEIEWQIEGKQMLAEGKYWEISFN